MFAGIETHKDTFAVAVVDQVGLPWSGLKSRTPGWVRPDRGAAGHPSGDAGRDRRLGQLWADSFGRRPADAGR